MATIEEVMFETTIEKNKKNQVLRHSEIEDMVSKAEDQFNEMKKIIQTIPNCSNESARAYVDIGLHSRKMNELFAYRNYELSRYFREIMDSSKGNTTSSRTQNQDNVDAFINNIDTSGGVFEYEKYNLINNGLVKDIESLKAELNSLTKMIEDKKVEISVIKNELHNTRQTIDTNFENKFNEVELKLRSKIETAQAFLKSLSELPYYTISKAEFLDFINRKVSAHNID